MDVIEMIAVVGGLRSYEHVVVIDNLVETQQSIVIIVGRSEKVFHLFLGYLSIKKIIVIKGYFGVFRSIKGQD